MRDDREMAGEKSKAAGFRPKAAAPGGSGGQSASRNFTVQ